MDVSTFVIAVISGIVGAIFESIFRILQNTIIIWIKNKISDLISQPYNPKYNEIIEKNDILVIRRWNNRDRFDEDKIRITYNKERVYDSKNPIIKCPFITAPEEWEGLYTDELNRNNKKNGRVSYVTSISLDHPDTTEGRYLEIEVSSCDYLGHHVNSKYFTSHPEDWEKIKKVIQEGNLNDYFSFAMPGNLFVNFILINNQTKNVLAVKRSSQELNARNVWALGGFETMNDISGNSINETEEKSLIGIALRGLREEFAIKQNEVHKIEICSLSFVKHLGIMPTALVILDFNMSEREFIDRTVNKSTSAFEHNDLFWLPIRLRAMRNYIKKGTGYYNKILKRGRNGKEKWMNYTKLQMYEIWRNHSSIGL